MHTHRKKTYTLYQPDFKIRIKVHQGENFKIEMIGKWMIFWIVEAFCLTNADTADQSIENLTSLGLRLFESKLNSYFNTTKPVISAHKTTEIKTPHTEAMVMAGVIEKATVSGTAAPETITTETMTPKSASSKDSATTEFIVTTETFKKTLETTPDHYVTLRPPTSTAGLIISDVLITNPAPTTDPLAEHVAVIWDGVNNFSKSIEQECKYKSNTECDLYTCINRNIISKFDISQMGGLNFVQLGKCFPDTLDFTDSTLNSKSFDKDKFKNFIDTLHLLLQSKNIREIFAILDYGLSDDEKNIKSSYAGLLYAVEKMKADPVDLRALKMLMKSEKFNQGWNELFKSDIAVSDLTEKLGVKGYKGLYQILKCGLKSYGQQKALNSFFGGGSTADTQALFGQGVNWFMGIKTPAPSPKFDMTSMLISQFKNMVKDILTVDWTKMNLTDITSKILQFKTSIENPCVQKDIIEPIKSTINEKTDGKFSDYVVSEDSIGESEFSKDFSEETVPEKEPEIEISPADMTSLEPEILLDLENEPSFASKWVGNVSTDTYRQ